jgi:hypothetical protein
VFASLTPTFSLLTSFRAVESEKDDGADEAAPIARLPNGLVIVKNPQTPEECEAAIDDLRGMMVQMACSDLERNSHMSSQNSGGASK